MEELEIRQTLPEDAEKLLAYSRRIGAETDNLSFGAEGFPAAPEEERRYLRQMLEQERSVHLTAWRSGEIVGDGSLSALPRRMSHRAELGLAVVRAEWGRGVGSRLMGALIDYAQGHGVELISLEVRADNARAIHVYEKHGFRRIGTFPAYFKIDGAYYDFDLMCLDLR